MTPINEEETSTESALWKEQAARNVISAKNSLRWHDMQQYFKSLPDHHAKAKAAPVSDNTHEVSPQQD